MTSNENFLDSGELFNDHILATAILNYLLYHASTLTIKSESH
jgi:DNA replication protein DnaC